MSGTLTELSAIGVQDQYTSVDPEMTYWQGEYMRPAKFSREPIDNLFTPQLKFGNTAVCTINRNGDLVKDMWLRLKFPKLADASGNQLQDESGDGLSAWVNGAGHAAIETISVEIGGHLFEEQTGEYLELLTSNHEKSDTCCADHEVGYYATQAERVTAAGAVLDCWVPLRFWFNRFAEQALPMVGLSYHEVKIKVKLRPLAQLWELYDSSNAVQAQSNAVSDPTFTTFETDPVIVTDYIFLEDEERRYFANEPLQYLIDVVQHPGAHPVSTALEQTFRLDFTHPVKELLFGVQLTSKYTLSDGTKLGFFDYTDSNGACCFSKAHLEYNGNRRSQPMDSIYWVDLLPAKHHSRKQRKRDAKRLFGCMIWGMDPESPHPTGQVNMSRIDTVNMKLTLRNAAAGELHAYARAMNVLKIANGMAGLKYAS